MRSFKRLQGNLYVCASLGILLSGCLAQAPSSTNEGSSLVQSQAPTDNGSPVTPDSTPINPNLPNGSIESNNDDIETEIPVGQTPQELGDQFPQLLGQAKQSLAALPADMLLSFPLGVNTPVLIGDIQDTVPKYEVIGFVDSDGQPSPLIASDLLALLEQFTPRDSATRQHGNLLVADIRQEVRVAQEVQVLNLIAREIDTDEIYVLPNIRVIAVFRDALNAVLNDELRETNLDVRQIEYSNLP